MRQFTKGYIGKSFTLGFVGIVGTLVACGGGGITSTVAQSSAPASPYILFASQYQLIAGATSEPYAKTQEMGNIYGFSGGGFTYQWGLGTDANIMKERQAYGVQFGHSAAITNTSYFGLAVSAPENGSVNATNSNYLVIQMGNGSSTDAFPNTHMKFTVAISGGGSQAVDYSWPAVCEYDKTLDATSRIGTGKDASANPFGLRTYRIALSDFTCSSGNLSNLKADVREIAVKIVGGKDSTASATANNSALLQIGYLAFSKN